MNWDGVKDALSVFGWVLMIVFAAIFFICIIIGMKYLCAYIAEQLGIPYVWVL